MYVQGNVEDTYLSPATGGGGGPRSSYLLHVLAIGTSLAPRAPLTCLGSPDGRLVDRRIDPGPRNEVGHRIYGRRIVGHRLQ